MLRDFSSGSEDRFMPVRPSLISSPRDHEFRSERQGQRRVGVAKEVYLSQSRGLPRSVGCGGDPDRKHVIAILAERRSSRSSAVGHRSDTSFASGATSSTMPSCSFSEDLNLLIGTDG